MDKSPGKYNDLTKPKTLLESINCAMHVKYHYALALSALVLGLFLRLSAVEFVLFALAVVILLFAEMVNTAIEETVNLVEERHHIIAKNAKDVSAGAVLISSVGVGIVAFVILFKYIDESATMVLTEARDYAGYLAGIALLIVLISVVATKAVLGRGRPFYGGMPSGHSAVAFSLWTLVSLITLEPIVVILTFIMALMVSQSRLIGGIHTRLEVFLGALLGTGLTLLIFKIFSATLK
jgi:diacylglycerol kinase (ATP)